MSQAVTAMRRLQNKREDDDLPVLPVSLRTMLFMAALASSVVASTPTVLPRSRSCWSSRPSTL